LTENKFIFTASNQAARRGQNGEKSKEKEEFRPKEQLFFINLLLKFIISAWYAKNGMNEMRC
jgi:hypothetical protein